MAFITWKHFSSQGTVSVHETICSAEFVTGSKHLNAFQVARAQRAHQKKVYISNKVQIMSAFANEPAYIKVVFYLLYSTDIPYTALIKEMVGVNTMPKTPEATNNPWSLNSAWQSFMSCRCSVDCLPQHELRDFYLFPLTHRGSSSIKRKSCTVLGSPWPQSLSQAGLSSLGMEGSTQERAGVNVSFRDLWPWTNQANTEWGNFSHGALCQRQTRLSCSRIKGWQILCCLAPMLGLSISAGLLYVFIYSKHFIIVRLKIC